ncbi:MAG: hypothetical protein EOO04_21615 [Chitinophagaceae bacterium]|nr:MAG: hypothetical protein EOO04_21615 [Chitinophagaceae bacterium]
MYANVNMEKTSVLIEGLRKSASNLRAGAFYAWGHHGACNCGHLLQVITKLTKEEIQSYAHTGSGEWTEIVEESCAVTGIPLGLLITELRSMGLTNTDIHNLEYLEDRSVLNNLPGGFRWLKRNQRDDVIIYFETYANMLEEKMLEQIEIPSFNAAASNQYRVIDHV